MAPQLPVRFALQHKDAVFGRGMIRENTEHGNFTSKLQFHLDGLGLAIENVMFLDNYDNLLDASELFEELKGEAGSFDSQVIHPHVLSVSSLHCSCLDTALSATGRFTLGKSGNCCSCLSCAGDWRAYCSGGTSKIPQQQGAR